MGMPRCGSHAHCVTGTKLYPADVPIARAKLALCYLCPGSGSTWPGSSDWTDSMRSRVKTDMAEGDMVSKRMMGWDAARAIASG